MNMAKAVENCFSKFATFKGRATRSEYWWFFLAVTLFSYLVQIVVGITTFKDQTAGLFASIFMFIFFCILSIPQISAASRRLHDTGRSGWWLLISFTLIGLIPLTIWLAKEGSSNENQYGPPPSNS